MNYYHLNIEERTVINQLYKSGVTIREIAKQIGRGPSTISREFKRKHQWLTQGILPKRNGPFRSRRKRTRLQSGFNK